MLKNMYFSQNALNAYNTCQLKFRYRYIDGLYWPKLWDGQESLRDAVEMGQKFHLIAQRYCEGFDPQVPEEEPNAEKLRSWLFSLKNFLPLKAGHTYLPEHEIRMAKDGVKILSKYDLVQITPENKVIIYDWKTYRKAKKRPFLENQMQTKVYMYTFAEAGQSYAPCAEPEDVIMYYWHPEHLKSGIEINYNKNKHMKNEELLFNQIREILNKDYEDFVATSNESICKSCEYRPICQGVHAEYIDSENLIEDDYIDIGEIEEMAF